jgi:riboflavin synthase
MFTGIIKKVSKVVEVSQNGGSFFVVIEKPKIWKIKAGDSISINGVCSTVRVVKKDKFEVEYMPETLAKTTVGNFEKGGVVNLERSLKINDLLDGHIVQGHVDGVGVIMNIEKISESVVMRISAPRNLIKFIAPKGSVAIDGISLTVVDTGKDWLAATPKDKNKNQKKKKELVWWFSVSLVSYTLENTNLKYVKIGDRVNIETDVLAKYIVNYLKNK